VYAKKALSGFMFFGNEKRPALLEESLKKFGKKDVGYAAKAIGALWGKMDDKAKAPFQKMADKDKIRFDKQIASGMTTAPRKVKKDKKAKKDPNAPKRPSSGFMRWMSENRSKIIDEHKLDKSKVADVARKGGLLWKEVDQKIKDKYQVAFEKDSAKYQKEMEKYKAQQAAEAA